MAEATSKTKPTPKQFIGSLALVVRDYDEAIAWFTQKLGFELICDEVQSPAKRWVLVRPPSIQGQGQGQNCSLLLAKGVGEKQEGSIGNQTGGRVFLFLHTDDFWRDFEKYKEAGVKFVRDPKVEPYGAVAVFEDLCGNLWDLVEMKEGRLF